MPAESARPATGAARTLWLLSLLSALAPSWQLFDDVGPDLWTRQAEVSRTFFADLFDPERRLPDAEREAIAATLSMMSLLLPHAHEPALGEVSLLTFGDTLAALLARGVAR